MTKRTLAGAAIGGIVVGVCAMIIIQLLPLGRKQYSVMRIDVDALRLVRATLVSFQAIEIAGKVVLVPRVSSGDIPDRLIRALPASTALTQSILSNYDISTRHIDIVINTLPAGSYLEATAIPCTHAGFSKYVCYSIKVFNRAGGELRPAPGTTWDFVEINPCPPARTGGYPYSWPSF